MAIQQDAQDYYYNETNQNGCWGGGAYTPQGYYEPSNYYMHNNAWQIYQDLQLKGWSFNPIMAVIGNMCYESYLNPAQSEIGKPLDGTYGYGLAQWTPCATTIKSWLNSNNYPLTSGFYQLEYLDTDPDSKWDSHVAAYNNMTFNEFKHSTLTVDYLTNAFRACYEKGLANSYRNYCAAYYEREFGGGTTGNQIYVTYTGNGYAYASPTSVEAGDTFTLYATPNSGESLVNITGRDSNGYAIAMDVVPRKDYTYYSSYGSYIIIEVEFTGTTPPPPPPARRDRKKHMSIWMYPMLRRIERK